MKTAVDTTRALLDAARSDGWLRTDVRRSFSDEQLLDAEMLSNALLVETVFEPWWELPAEQLRETVDHVMRHRPPEHPPLVEGEAFRLAEIITRRRKNDNLLTLEMTLAMLNAVHTAEGLSEATIRTRLERSAQEFFSEVRPTLPSELPPSTSARSSLLAPRSIDEAPDPRTGMVDLGRIRLPLLPGMALDPREQDGAQLGYISVGLENEGANLDVFSGRDLMDWDLVRENLKQEFGEADREVRERLGIFGVQLESYIPVPDGFHRLRIIGHSEPMWTLRAIITGASARTAVGTPEMRRLIFGTLVDAAAPTLHLPTDAEHQELIQSHNNEARRVID